MKSIQGRFRAAVLMGAAASVLVFAGGAKAQDQSFNGDGNPNSSDNSWPYATTGRSPVLAVVGDVSCQPGEEPSGEKAGENCSGDKTQNLNASQAATAAEIESLKPDLVALVGDEQYQVGQYKDYENSYDLTYGAFKMITRPAPGNHEFYVEHGAIGVAGYGYFSYFNGVQHNPDGTVMTATIANNPDTGGTFTQPVPYSDGQAGHFEETGGLGNTVPAGGPVGVGDGWYSYNLGAWHFISLNIECETQPGACSSSGTWFAAETEWLKKDLDENHAPCTLAYWHQPTYSAADSLTEEGITAGTWWQMLYDAGADLVLNGHDHLYARYAPIRPYFDSSDTSVAGVTGTWLGKPDPKRGIREFIVGTGGETLDTLVTAPCTTSGATECTAPVTPATDYDGIFNQQFLENGTGFYWGVMGLTLDPNGYKWDFESALEAPLTGAPASPTFSDTGSAACHGGPFGNNYGDDRR